MRGVYFEVELFDVIVDDDSIEIGEMQAVFACFVDSGSTRSVITDVAAARVKTIRAPQLALYRSGAYPVRYVAMRLARRGYKPRIIEAAVSKKRIEDAGTEGAAVLLGQDYLRRDRITARAR